MATFFSAERNGDNGEDYISELPDDILLTFVSCMGIKDAAKTSILSKRWRNLWAQRTDLDFNHLIVLPDVEYIPDAGQNSKYINWVNQVVGLHCNQCIDTFRVCSRFDSNDAHHLDKWVKFALSKKVKNLQLDLISYQTFYTIGLDILKPLSLVDSFLLKTLHLSNIDVSGDFLEYLLSHCSLLERIYVHGSRTLVRLKVTGLSCKLKQLIIRCCCNLEQLEIDAVNLIYLECEGGFTKNANLVLKSVPMLDEPIFGWGYLYPSHSIFQHLSELSHPFWARISKLSLDLMCGDIPTGVLPTFCNLKQLNMTVYDFEISDLVALTRLLKACPVLHEFKPEITWRVAEDDDGMPPEAADLKKLDLSVEAEAGAGLGWDYFSSVAHMEPTTHPHLKLVKVVGFRGSDYDVKIIRFLGVLASNLETIVCDPGEWELEVTIEASRSRAAKLVKLIPPKIRLVII